VKSYSLWFVGKVAEDDQGLGGGEIPELYAGFGCGFGDEILVVGEFAEADAAIQQ